MSYGYLIYTIVFNIIIQCFIKCLTNLWENRKICRVLDKRNSQPFNVHGKSISFYIWINFNN